MAYENDICILSDCQLPLTFEKLSFRAHKNKKGRDLIFADILGQHPGCLILLGDLIGMGSRAGAWKAVNVFLSAVRGGRGIVHAIPGNHEYLLNAKKGMNNYIERFGHRQVMGYCIKRGALAIVMLNSNFDHVLPDDMMWQQIWFGNKMDALDGDGAIQSIVVCARQTRSGMVRTEVRKVAENEAVPLGPFAQSRMLHGRNRKTVRGGRRRGRPGPTFTPIESSAQHRPGIRCAGAVFFLFRHWSRRGKHLNGHSRLRQAISENQIQFVLIAIPLVSVAEVPRISRRRRRCAPTIGKGKKICFQFWGGSSAIAVENADRTMPKAMTADCRF
jgi:hypothetical protein